MIYHELPIETVFFFHIYVSFLDCSDSPRSRFLLRLFTVAGAVAESWFNSSGGLDRLNPMFYPRVGSWNSNIYFGKPWKTQIFEASS
jgi:hypothetical protein